MDQPILTLSIRADSAESTGAVQNALIPIFTHLAAQPFIQYANLSAIQPDVEVEIPTDDDPEAGIIPATEEAPEIGAASPLSQSDADAENQRYFESGWRAGLSEALGQVKVGRFDLFLLEQGFPPLALRGLPSISEEAQAASVATIQKGETHELNVLVSIGNGTPNLIYTEGILIEDVKASLFDGTPILSVSGLTLSAIMRRAVEGYLERREERRESEDVTTEELRA